MNLSRITASTLAALLFISIQLNADCAEIFSNEELEFILSCPDRCAYVPHNIADVLAALNAPEVGASQVACYKDACAATQKAMINLVLRKDLINPNDYQAATELLEDYQRALESGEAVIHLEYDNATGAKRFSNETLIALTVFSSIVGNRLVIKENADIGGSVFINGNEYIGGSLTVNGAVNFTTNITTPTTCVNTLTLYPDPSLGNSGSIVKASSCSATPTLFIHNTGSTQNIFAGENAGNSNIATTAIGNTGLGAAALNALTTGTSNTAVGYKSLLINDTGSENVAIGQSALKNNTSGYQNTAVGSFALTDNVNNGINNTAVGFNALPGLGVTTGNQNTAIGSGAIGSTSATLNNNTAVGYNTLPLNAAGNNTALGASAGASVFTGGNNTIIGQGAAPTLATGTGNIIIGIGADVSTDPLNNGILLSTAGAKITNSDQIRIGFNSANTSFIINTYIDGIYGVAGTGHTVNVTSTGQLVDANASSKRFKNNIKALDIDASKILALKPVTFNWNNDQARELDMGLIAEEVYEVLPELAVYNKEGEIHGVQYRWLPIMILSVVKQQQDQIDDLLKRIEQLEQK